MTNTAKKIIATVLLALSVALLCACGYLQIATYTVNFYDGDELVSTVTVYNPSSLKPPNLSDRDGYEVVCWRQKDGEAVFGDDHVFSYSEDYVAVWQKKTYSITYILNGGTKGFNPETYTVEDSFTLEDAYLGGFEFIGWTSEKSATPKKSLTIEKGTVGDLVFTANFVEENVYYLYFDTLGGTSVERERSETGVFDFSGASEKTGYELSGWYIDEDLTLKATFPFVATENVTVLYAKWTPVTYYVYSVDDLFEPIAYNIETPNFTIEPINKTGYEFVGFSENGGKTEAVFTVIQGSHKNYSLTAHFNALDYTLTFDTLGGDAVSDFVAHYGEEIVFPEPTKSYCEFIGWFTDPLCENEFTSTLMPAKDLTLYAGWQSDINYTLRFSASVAAAGISSNKYSGGLVTYGERVTLSAPAYADGAIFDRWESGGELYSYDNALEFKMPQNDLNLVAAYSPVETIYYDLNSGKDLIFKAKNVSAVDGMGLREGDVSIDNDTVYIKNSFMSGLSVGYYPIVLSLDTKKEYRTVKVTSLKSLYRAKIDYDIAFPNVALLIEGEEGVAFEYSLDGAAFVAAGALNILDGYDKYLAHSVTVRCVDDGEQDVTIEKEGFNESESGFLTESFDYGGRTYDKVVDSDDELQALFDYVMFVYAPQNKSPSKYAGGSATFEFIFGKEYYAEERQNIDEKITIAFNRASAPYVPRNYYSPDYQRGIFTITINFNTDTPNEITSGQAQANVSNKQALNKRSSRADDFDDFKIEGYELSQNIRTLYELENLPFNVKPVFDGDGGQAKEVYEKAKELLRYFVDDDMSDLEKVVAIYDYLALNVTYDRVTADIANSNENEDIGKYRAFTSYGALIDNIAVCDGIAGAFALMCKIEGIECIEVVGSGNGGGHAWNKVKIGGLWYIADATWGSISIENYQFVTHAYLFMDEIFSESCGHEENGKQEESLKSVDNCAISPLNYYDANILVGLDYTVDSSSDLIAIINAKKAEGATAVDVKFAKGLNVLQIINRVKWERHINITCYELAEDVYMLIFN